MLVVIEIVTAHLSRSREGEQEKAREKVLLWCWECINKPERQIKSPGSFDTSWEHRWYTTEAWRREGEALVREWRFCSVNSSHICTGMSWHVFRNRAYFAPLDHSFAGCWSSMISSGIHRILGMEGTENLNYKDTKETYFHVFYGNHISVHALLKNTSLGTIFAGEERTGQLL